MSPNRTPMLILQLLQPRTHLRNQKESGKVFHLLERIVKCISLYQVYVASGVNGVPGLSLVYHFYLNNTVRDNS